jgi:hypothetical protein
MPVGQRQAVLPREAILLTTYAQLDLYLEKFAAGEFGLLLLLGRHGTGKSESVRRALGSASFCERNGDPVGPDVLYVEGHVQPYGLYRDLWEHRDQPVVLDDLDKLHADGNCVRLLKPLCNTERARRITWLSNLTLNDHDVPASFVTTSNVILIANEWRTVNPSVRALEDRAIILHFDPPKAELHRRVAEWFDDADVYSFIERILPSITELSMRHYCKGSQLRRAGLSDWRSSVLQMVLPDPRMACVVALQHEPTLGSEQERVERFVTSTGCSRATYYRMKARLAGAGPLEGGS